MAHLKILPDYVLIRHHEWFCSLPGLHENIVFWGLKRQSVMKKMMNRQVVQRISTIRLTRVRDGVIILTK